MLSVIGLLEILAGPARASDAIGFEMTADVLRDLPVRISPLDAGVAEDAAWTCGQAGASMPDAIHLACAIRAGATTLVMNDRRMPTPARSGITELDGLVA